MIMWRYLPSSPSSHIPISTLVTTIITSSSNSKTNQPTIILATHWLHSGVIVNCVLYCPFYVHKQISHISTALNTHLYSIMYCIDDGDFFIPLNWMEIPKVFDSSHYLHPTLTLFVMNEFKCMQIVNWNPNVRKSE